jgi:tetratricopeptide (TPR) repeat protein
MTEPSPGHSEQRVKTIRVFISSPGDVKDERDKARLVIERLSTRYAGRAVIIPVLWEDLPLQVDASFQQGIDLVLSREHGIDVAVFILWSRLGSPTGPLIRQNDGTEYRSGTEREFDLMLQARRQSRDQGQPARPAMLAYHRQDREGFHEALKGKETHALEQMIEQQALAESFIKEEFHDEDGRNLRAYHTYRRPPEFCARLRVHLIELLDEMLGMEAGGERWEGSPYVGLAAFDFGQERIFRGRDREVCELGEALRAQAERGCASVLVLGPSGSGKSSLARAGLLPALCLHELDDTVAQWRRATLRPGENAGDLVLSLARALAGETALPELREEAVGGPDQLATDLRESAQASARQVETTVRQVVLRAFSMADHAANGSVRLALLVDQLEELFTDAAVTAEERIRFFAVLEALARCGRVWVVMTARSDFYAQLQEIEPLRRMKEGAGQYDLLPVGDEALRRIIGEPARIAGLRFERAPTPGEAGLEERIFADALKHPEALPHLQFLLRELYEGRTAKGELTHAAYDGLGGVGGVLARRAEGVLQATAEEAQAAFDSLFRALVSVKTEEHQRPVRRSAPMEPLMAEPGRKALTEALVEARLLTTDRDSAGRPVVAVAHEALLRSWPRLAGWIEANRRFLKVRARTEGQAREWKEAPEGRKSDLLLPAGLLLEEANSLLREHRADLGPAEQEFITRSAEADRARREAELARLQRRNLIFATLACLAMIAAVVAALQWRQAAVRRKEAVAAKKAADELIRYMQHDLSDTLWKIGYLKMMDGINERIRKYQEAHPPEAGDLNALREQGAAFVARGNILKDQGKLAEALKAYRDALAISEGLTKKDSNNAEWQGDLSILYEKVGNVLSAQGQLAEALKEYRDALAIREGLVKKDPDNARWQGNILTNYVQIGDALHAQGQIAEALKAYRHALTMSEGLAKKDPDNAEWQLDLSISYEHIGDVLSAQGQLADALKAYRGSLAIREGLAKKDPDNAESKRALWSSYDKVGDALRAEGQLADALKAYRNGFAISEGLAKQDPDNTDWQRGLSVGYQLVGDVLSDQGHLADALKAYRDALAIREGLAKKDPENAGWQFDLSFSDNKVGDVLRAQGQLDDALKAYRDALAIREGLAKKDPENAGWQRDLASSYGRIGGVLRDQGQLADALKAYRDALAIAEGLAKKDPENADWQRNLSVSYDTVGDVLRAQGQLADALKAYRDALTISEGLAKKDPENAGWQRDLASRDDNVGDALLAQSQLADALKAYRDALAIREGLTKKNPGNTYWQRNLSVSDTNVGDVLLAQGQLAEALKSYQNGLAIIERLAKKDPENPDWQLVLSVSYERVGDVLNAKGQRDDALKAYRDALAIHESLAKKNPGNAGWQRNLSVSYGKVGDVLIAQGQLAEALKTCRDALAIIERLAKKNPENPGWQRELASSYEKVGDIAQQQKQWPEAEESFLSAIEIARPWFSRANVEVAWVVIFSFAAGRRSMVLRDAPQGSVKIDREAALADLRTARDAMKRLKQAGRLVPPMDKNYPWIEGLLSAAEAPNLVNYIKVGDELNAQGQLANALKTYRDGLAIYEGLAKKDPDNTLWQNDLSVSYERVGNVLSAQGQLADALKAYRDALAIREALAKEDPENTLWQYNLSISYEKVGDVLSAQGQLDEALKSYQNGLAIREAFAKKNPENAGWQRDLSVSYERVGDVLIAQGQLAEALKAYQDALAIREGLAKKNPENAGWQLDLSIGYEKVGDVLLAQGQLAEALKSYQDGLAIREALTKKDPGNAGWKLDLSESDNNVGDVLFAQGQLAEALKSYQDGLAICEGLAKKDSDNADWQRDLSVSYEKVGDALSAQGQLVEALKACRDGLAIMEALAKKDAGNARWQHDLAISYEKIGRIAAQQKQWHEAAESLLPAIEIARPWLSRADIDVGWVSDFSNAAGRRWEVLRDAPQGSVHIDRDAALADLRAGRDAMKRLKQAGRFVPEMDKNLPWIEGLLSAAEAPKE